MLCADEELLEDAMYVSGGTQNEKYVQPYSSSL